MADYAKAPWRAEGWESLVVNDAEGNTLALAPGGRDATLGERQATARLIAAAPVLLAACEAMRDCLMRFPSRAWIALLEGEQQKINGALDHAVEAIRAATGEGE